MAVQWNLAGDGFNATEALQSYGQAAQQRLVQQREAMALRQQQQQLAARRQVGGMVAGGDLAGARNTALQGGDFDLASTVNGYEDHHRQELQQRAELVGGIAASLKPLPPEQRAAAFRAIAPQLVERGIPADQLAQVDLSDQGLDGYIGFATQAKDAIAAYHKSQEPVVLADGSQLVRPADGRMIAENAKEAPKADYIFDSESGSWLLKPGTGGAGYPAPSGNQSPVTGQFAGVPGERITSGYRSPSHNAEVGGVPNSYHMQRDANGNPLARDSVPPAGMSMTQYADALRRENPGRDVIMEGDHVHMEPARRQSSPGTGSMTGAVINVRPPKAKGQAGAPSGYRFNGDRLEPIPGGPADPNTSTQRNVQSNRTAEANFRKEFDALPEVKTFKTGRVQFQTLRNLVDQPPNAQRDMAAIFTFMKTLDPTSTVREGEYASAKNAAGIPDRLQNAYNAALDGRLLTPQQRKQMVQAAGDAYKAMRDAYNQSAENYRGYARDNGIEPDRVARTYTPDKPAAARGAAAPVAHPSDIQSLIQKYGKR